jgi:hypothetical protein
MTRKSRCISAWRKTMFSKSFIRPLLTVALVLTTTGVASARRPPSLATLQEQTDRVLATCPSAPATSGYRDMLARSGSNHAPNVAYVAVARRAMRDHLVLKCAGGEVHESGGYRDMLVRFVNPSVEPQTARAGRYGAQ